MAQTKQQKYSLGALLPTKKEFDSLKKMNFTAIKKASTNQNVLTNPPSVMLTAPLVGNQGGEGSCVSWAVAYCAMSILEYQKYLNVDTALRSPAYVYNQTYVKNCNGGSAVNAALALLVNQGVCSIASMPYIDGACTTLPTATQTTDAALNKDLKWNAIITTDADGMKSALSLGYPIIITFTVYDSFWTMWGSGGKWTDSVHTGAVNGAHAVCIIGYDDSKQMFKVQNSWGNYNGDGYGYFWISYKVIAAGVLAEAYVMYPSHDLTPFVSATTLPGTAAQVTGTTLGSSIPNYSFHPAANAFDNDVTTFFDGGTANGQWAGLDLGSIKQISCVKFRPRKDFYNRMPGGKFQISTDTAFSNPVTIYTIPADAALSFQDYYITSINTAGVAAQYIRYLSPDGGNGNIAEITVYKAADGATFVSGTSCAGSPTQVTGTTLGSSIPNYTFHPAANAFDNDVTTFFDGGTPNGQWAGLDLGSSNQISCVKFRPRKDFYNRMPGGKFQIATDAAFSNPVTIYTIPASPVLSFQDYFITSTNTAGVAAQYIRYLSPDGGNGNIAEISVYRVADTTTFVSATACSGSTTQITGTTLGTSIPNYTFHPAANAFDNDVTTFFDGGTANGQWAGLDLGSIKQISCVKFRPRQDFYNRMPGGKFQIATDAAFSNPVTIYTIPANPVLSFQDYYITSTITAGVAAQYIRYLSPDGGNGNIAEITVYAFSVPTVNTNFVSATACSGATTQASGTVIGTSGSWGGSSSTIAKVFDGDNSTYFDGSTGNNQWAGLDLGTNQSITCIKFSPRSTWASRMLGGRFEISTDIAFTTPILLYAIPTNATLAATDNYLTSVAVGGVSARYIRYLSPDGGFGNIAEMTVYANSSTSRVSTSALLALTRTDSVKTNSALRVRTNPVEEILYIDGITKALKSVTLINVAGIPLKNYLNIQAGTGINVRSVHTGIYFLKLTDANGKTVIKKILKK